MSLQQKYLKYKNKYLKLKEQLGGYSNKLETLYYTRINIKMPKKLEIGSTIFFTGSLYSSLDNIIPAGNAHVYYKFVSDPTSTDKQIIDITLRLFLNDRAYEFVGTNIPFAQFKIEHGTLAPYELKTVLELNTDNTYKDEDANLKLQYYINNISGTNSKFTIGR